MLARALGKTLLTVLLVAVGSFRAVAEPAGPKVTQAPSGGINLSWGDCGKAGAGNLAFACGTDTVVPRLVASYVAPAGMAGFLGLSAQLTVTTAEALPDYWKHGADYCRGKTALASDFDFTRDTTCADFYAGAAVGGQGYVVESVASNRARILLQCAVPYDSRGALTEGREYYGFALRFLPERAGADTCRGCETPVCVNLDQIQLFQPEEARFDPVLSKAVSRAHVTWRGGPAQCPGTPAQTKGWGQVKRIHR